jgi:hypothetical protein
MALEAGVPEYGLNIPGKVHRRGRRYWQTWIDLRDGGVPLHWLFNGLLSEGWANEYGEESESYDAAHVTSVGDTGSEPEEHPLANVP